MKKWLPLLPLAWGLSFCQTVDEQLVGSLFQNYILAQEALAADNLDAAKQSLETLVEDCDDQLKAFVQQAAEAPDLDTTRKQFIQISEQLAEMSLPEGYVVAFCPMANDGKGANWVQRDGEIANPYFGSKMLRCGVKKSKE